MIPQTVCLTLRFCQSSLACPNPHCSPCGRRPLLWAPWTLRWSTRIHTSTCSSHGPRDAGGLGNPPGGQETPARPKDKSTMVTLVMGSQFGTQAVTVLQDRHKPLWPPGSELYKPPRSEQASEELLLDGCKSGRRSSTAVDSGFLPKFPDKHSHFK